MADKSDIALMSHLMRRAGFGASRAEIETRAERGYEATVDELLTPESQPPLDDHMLLRYHPAAQVQPQFDWLYRMVNSARPLLEKMALFWHHVFATGITKVEHEKPMSSQLALFREHGLANFKVLLASLGRDPAMIRWLDNDENHKRAPNENWGRELLELFSMGVGNYTEDDVKECARAFTGWTFTGNPRGGTWSTPRWEFRYFPADHDAGDKSFLGHRGRFNGDDIVEIVARQPAVHRFIARHLYNFFVADEPQVPAWPVQPPQDPDLIGMLCEELVRSDLEIKPVLRALFTSDGFKTAMYRKVKSPVEVVVGTLRLTGDMNGPDPRWGDLELESNLMGQIVLDPPSVEGWHTGAEWVNSGALMRRVNFVADRVGDPSLPGVADIVRRVAALNGDAMEPTELLDACLDMVGPMEVSGETYGELLGQVESDGPASWATDSGYAASAKRTGELLALIASTREYQFG